MKEIYCFANTGSIIDGRVDIGQTARKMAPVLPIDVDQQKNCTNI